MPITTYITQDPRGIALPITFPNAAPSSIFHKEISFTTVDENSGNSIDEETYIINGPTSTGISTIRLRSHKIVIPLTSSQSEGAPYLKIHLPGSVDKKMYITFCISNSLMQDGYYDYTTGIPDAYRNALNAWVTDNRSQYLPSITLTKSLKFTAYGESTNKPREAVTFYVNFQSTSRGYTVADATYAKDLFE